MESNNQQNQQSNFIVYILLFCIVLFMAVSAIILTQYEIISKNEFKNNFVKKSNVTFESLPNYIQDEYVEKYNCNQQEKIKIVEVEKVVTEIKNVEVEKEVQTIVSDDIFTKSNYKVAKCYDMSSGAAWLSKKCKKDIASFLEKNTDAKYFEVIGVVSKEDFFLLDKLKKNKDVLEKLNLTDKKIETLENYADEGLSKKRVEATSWFIKKTLGVDTKVLPVNYHITSKHNNKGTVVRVYY